MDIPDPPIPPGADLRHMPGYMINTQRLMTSELAAKGDPAANWYAVLTWCAAHHQVPAGSLPDDDETLAYLVGLGRDVRKWRRYRDAGALRGWQKHSDGRLYHPVVTECVLSLIGKSQKATNAANKRHHGKTSQPVDIPQSQTCERNADAMPTQCRRNATEEKGIEDKGYPLSANADVPLPAEPGFELSPSEPETDPLAAAVETWNAMATKAGLPTVQRLTAKRRAALRARLAECGGATGWEHALALIRDNPFLTGSNDRGWRADFDFLTTASKFTKLMEGGYVRSANAGQVNGRVDVVTEATTRSDREAIMAAVIARMGAGHGDTSGDCDADD